MRARPDKIENILVVRDDRFGEFLLNIPALRALKESFPGSRLTVIVNPDIAQLAGCVAEIDKVIAWDRRSKSLPEKLRMARLLKKCKFDFAVMLNPSRDFNIITALAGIPVRAGYDRKWGFLLTRKLADTKYLGVKHEVEHNLDLVHLVGATTDNLKLSLSLEDGIINPFLEEFRISEQDKLVALHPWTSDPVKDWPHFDELAGRLAALPGVRLAIIGKNAREGADLSGPGGNVINLADRTSLMQLAAFLARCRVLVSCDSGPVHLSCCVGTPAVVLFSSAAPAKSAKRWGPWGGNNTVVEKPQLCDISVDEVLSAVKEKL